MDRTYCRSISPSPSVSRKSKIASIALMLMLKSSLCNRDRNKIHYRRTSIIRPSFTSSLHYPDLFCILQLYENITSLIGNTPSFIWTHWLFKLLVCYPKFFKAWNFMKKLLISSFFRYFSPWNTPFLPWNSLLYLEFIALNGPN